MSCDVSEATDPVMAAQIEGSGPPLIMLHGGFGCWRHWVRNIGPLAEHFTVHAFDLPSYGASAAIPKEMPAEDYLELVHDQIIGRFGPGSTSRRVWLPIACRRDEMCPSGARKAP